MRSFPEQLVADFLRAHRASGVYLRDSVARVAELASSKDQRIAEPATRAFFTSLVEPLADSFEPEAVTIYNRAFAQLIQISRRAPRAQAFNRELTQFGLVNEQDLIDRAGNLRHVPAMETPPDWTGKLRRIVVLSRVTLGADVAVTSVIVERLKNSCPASEIVLVGGSKLPQLFGGDRRLSFREIDYHRAGTAIERLLAWIDLLAGVRELTDDLERGEYLIVDPDTRLTQLGLLPVDVGDLRTPRHGAEPGTQLRSTGNGPGYLFFPSREYGNNTSFSLAELTSSWLDEVFGERVQTCPRVSPSLEDRESARELLAGLKGDSSRRIVAFNFGVGENELKRIGGDFEASLVLRLIQRGANIILDKGAGEDEVRRADAVIAEATQIERNGRRVRAVELDAKSLRGAATPDADAEILVWNGGIGMMAALIGESDLYIGYDSAGQHIAAAQDVPCIDVFAGFSSPRMLDRWRPTGKAETRVIAVNPANRGELPGGVLELALQMLMMS
ncbi:MAG: glycosyltransferase family 9 protein [Blastocatellia bacterium]